MSAGEKSPRRPPRRILVVDIGGTHVKFRIGARGPEEEFPSGRRLEPGRMVREISARLGTAQFSSRISAVYAKALGNLPQPAFVESSVPVGNL